MRLRPGVVLVLGVVVLGSGCSSSTTPVSPSSVSSAPAGPSRTPASSGSPSGSTLPALPRTTVPALKVDVVAEGFDHPWGVGFLPDGKVLVTERSAKLSLLSKGAPGATKTEVKINLGNVMATGEGGLLGLVIHPDFATTREFTTCLDYEESGRPVDIRLVTWKLSADGGSATRVKDLLTGLPVNPSGRHSGCRPALAADGALIVGTGDTARTSHAQDKTSLGGKTLRLDVKTGRPLPDNPFITSPNAKERYVYTYGHRNIQGVTIRPGTDRIYTVEHGTGKDDEINLITPGANYGWDPSKGGTTTDYDDSAEMTDLTRFPGAVKSVWSSGDPTEATSGGTFLTGPQWGAYDGALAVAALKGSKLLVMTLNQDGTSTTKVDTPKALDGTHRRLRATREGPDGALYVTSDNGGPGDVLLRITPKAP